MASLSVWSVLCGALICVCFAANVEEDHDLVLAEQPMLLLSTLNGTLVAVSKSTGRVLWTLNEDRVVDVPVDHLYGPRFLPNPKDGSLYALSGNGDQLERLPLTIPELVQLSPSHSSDGHLYTARKSDVWMAIDPATGTKLHSFSSEGVVSTTCPKPELETKAIYLARTAYTVTVYDSATNEKRWNATYLEYSSNSYTDPAAQDLLHFCSSSDGSVLSVDSLTGQEVWRQTYGSPVVSVYSVEDGGLRKIPVTTVAADTLAHLSGSAILAIRADTFSIKATDHVLQPSLFVGAQHGQVYTLDALVEEDNLNYESFSFPLLEDHSNPARDEDEVSPGPAHSDGGPASSGRTTTDKVFQVGHYCLPEEADISFIPFSHRIEEELKTLWEHRSTHTDLAEPTDVMGYESPVLSPPPLPAQHGEQPPHPAGSVLLPLVTVVASGLLAAVIAVVVTKLGGKQSQSVQLSLQTSSTDSHVSAAGEATPTHSQGSVSEDCRDNISRSELRIGNIVYFCKEVLGHGCQGTVVFRGVFDKRPVAVKRILPECFDLADREVDLLRQSDEHANVIRYFCTEQDASFRYIALELCQATLHEFVYEKKFEILKVDPTTVLHQAVKGLAYLHSLGIVHRDIKPRNVLLSYPGSGGELRAMISDFGLCRKLPHGKVSFTAMSGLAGTEGWIAPEMLNSDNTRVTCAVDIFSMGCVLYYVLTGGKHPFGEPLRRQANIEAGDYVLSALTGVDRLSTADLVKNMISNNCLFRPTAVETLSHCLFWSKEKKLAFFQDVSDRIEKESASSPIVQALECGGVNVVCGDWRNNISDELRDDLRKFRSYQGMSVRDLLRAMRNKKHHYRELPEALKLSLGHIPDEFVDYFISRFPLLLIHTYKKMEICKQERIFQVYYKAHFTTQ